MKILKTCVLLSRVQRPIKSAHDRTTYGRARNSTRNFYLHHTRLISKAAVTHDAMAIREQAGPGRACLRQPASLPAAHMSVCMRCLRALALEGPPLHRVRG
jgi:hypothetical protein